MALRRSGVYLGWVGYQNLGDEAMWHVCRERFSSIQWSLRDDLTVRIGVGAAGHAMRDLGWLWNVAREELRDGTRLRLLSRKWFHRISSAITGEVGMLGGGTLINRNQEMLNAYTDMRKHLKRPIPIFGGGVCSPEYWSGTDGWVDRRAEWAELLRELPAVGVRGPYSKAALDDAGLRNVVISGDPAVLLHEKLTLAVAAKERLTIAVNFGEPMGGMIGSAERVEHGLCEAMRSARKQHTIKVLPVWPGDVAACTRLALRAGLTASDVTAPRVSHEAFRDEIRDVDFFIAFKLHAGILAAAYNVPFVMFEYQPKCLDFLASLEWEKRSLRPESFSAEALLEEIEQARRDGYARRQEICAKMCSLARCFEVYCEKISPLLLG